MTRRVRGGAAGLDGKESHGLPRWKAPTRRVRPEEEEEQRPGVADGWAPPVGAGARPRDLGPLLGWAASEEEEGEGWAEGGGKDLGFGGLGWVGPVG